MNYKYDPDPITILLTAMWILSFVYFLLNR